LAEVTNLVTGENDKVTLKVKHEKNGNVKYSFQQLKGMAAQQSVIIDIAQYL
jgi:hypothetical protein